MDGYIIVGLLCYIDVHLQLNLQQFVLLCELATQKRTWFKKASPDTQNVRPGRVVCIHERRFIPNKQAVR